MTVRRLKDLLDLSKLPDGAEVVVHSDSRCRDYLVADCRIQLVSSLYFGGSEPSSIEPCLVLEID
jgi:hypothetical protein